MSLLPWQLEAAGHRLGHRAEDRGCALQARSLVCLLWVSWGAQEAGWGGCCYSTSLKSPAAQTTQPGFLTPRFCSCTRNKWSLPPCKTQTIQVGAAKVASQLLLHPRSLFLGPRLTASVQGAMVLVAAGVPEPPCTLCAHTQRMS